MTTKRTGSTSHPGVPHSTGRYAHPFYTTVPHAQRRPVNGDTRMTDWSKKQLGKVPPVLRDGRMDLADVIGLIRSCHLTAEFARHIQKPLRSEFRKLVRAVKKEMG